MVNCSAPLLESPDVTEPSEEEPLQRALEAGDARTATTLLLQAYGPEVMRFLAAFHAELADLEEVFSAFAEALFRSCESFRGDCGARTWVYAVARRTSLRHRRDRARHRARFVPFPDDQGLAELEQRVRTETASFLRTERRSALLELRASLSEADQVLLTLRVDRRLPFEEIAVVLHEGESDGASTLDGEARRRASARLRKRFQTLKERLREAGRKAGLVDPEGG